MVYHNQNYWDFGLSPSSGILGNRKHDVSETGSVSVLRCGGGETSTQLGPLDKANLNQGLYRAQMSKRWCHDHNIWTSDNWKRAP
jgi:hypothetical protein